MTELFRPDGHLTDEGLRALVGGELDELGRLEAAEHLSFCDACLVRYTALLEGEVLQEPPTDQTLPVMRRLRRRAAQALMSRYTAAAAAVLITGTLWYTGIFAGIAGVFTVQGEEMHVEQLDVEEGRLVVGGEIGSLSYDEGAGGGKGNLLGRIFR